MPSPLPRRSHWRYGIAHPSRGISLPRKGDRVGLRIVFFEACSAFTRVTACTLALSPICDSLSEGFSHFLTSMTAPLLPAGAFAGWDSHPLESAAFSRRTPGADDRASRKRTLDARGLAARGARVVATPSPVPVARAAVDTKIDFRQRVNYSSEARFHRLM